VDVCRSCRERTCATRSGMSYGSFKGTSTVASKSHGTSSPCPAHSSDCTSQHPEEPGPNHARSTREPASSPEASGPGREAWNRRSTPRTSRLSPAGSITTRSSCDAWSDARWLEVGIDRG
jgi:hypothetical protein